MIFSRKRNLNQESDIELIEKFRYSGDKNFVGEIFKRHSGFVFAICLKYVQDKEIAEELLMEIFESLFQKLMNHEVTNFKSWLHTLTRNHCLHYFRNTKYEQKHLGQITKEIKKNVDFDEELYPDYSLKEEKLVMLENNLNELKQEQRICVELFYLKEMSYAQIIDETGFSYKDVKSHIQNGKRNLKILFEKKNE